MKHLKIYEYYYDQNGKLYDDEEYENLPDSFFSNKNNKVKYINESMEKHIPELIEIKDRLIDINNEMEIYGPLDEEIQDSVDALNNAIKKWENRPIMKLAAKKYNIGI